MIKSKKDYLYYIKSDKIALKITKQSFASKLKNLILPNRIWQFQKLLRKLEYYKNVKIKKSIIYYLPYLFYKRKFQNLSIRLGFSIPENVFGPGLAIVHYGTIIVNSRAKVGTNCRIHACTNIGESGGVAGAPTLGDNVYIAPGVKIYGKINIPSNSVIAANSVVNKSFEKQSMLIAGMPAIQIKKADVSKIIKHIKKL
jgi:serine O-acetyltransferase